MPLIRLQKDPSPRQLRGFGLVWLIFFGVVGYLVLRRTGSVPAATAVWVAAAGVPAVGLFWLPLLKAAFLGMSYAAFPIGWVVSHVVLAVVYYAVLTPIGLGMRLVGRDPMHRRLEPDAKSYWLPHRPTDDPARYLRQF